MIRYISILFVSFVLVYSSCTFDVCSSKRMYVNSYEQFMKKVEKKQDKFTAREWEEMDETFERFSGECFDKYQDDLTTKERKQITKYSFKYVVIRVKSELPFDFSEKEEEEVQEFLDELDVDVDGIKYNAEEVKKFFENLDTEKFKEAAEEFGKGFEKLEKALEEFGKELKEAFEESTEEEK